MAESPPPIFRRRSSSTSSTYEKSVTSQHNLLSGHSSSPRSSPSQSPTRTPSLASSIPSPRITKRILKRTLLFLSGLILFAGILLFFLPKTREKIKGFIWEKPIASIIDVKGLKEEDALEKALEVVIADVQREDQRTGLVGGGRIDSDFMGLKLVGELDPYLVPIPSSRSAVAPANATATDSLHLTGRDITETKKPGHDISVPHTHKKRLIIIGDIHGMLDPLEDLLHKVKFDPNTDHIVSTGDMISKGPQSKAVVRLMMSYNASAVRGNHEDRILLAWKGMQRKALALLPTASQPRHPLPQSTDFAIRGNDDFEIPEDELTGEDKLDIQLAETATFTRSKEYKDRLLAKKLGKKQLTWLASHPVILKVGHVQGLGDVVVVHGGLVPGIQLERQDPYAVMNMRTIDLGTRIPSEAHKGVQWTKVCLLLS